MKNNDLRELSIMEELLTDAEILLILAEAAKPDYEIENLYHFTSKKLHISKVSKKGLIFIHGNKHTGMEHIRLRHSITSRKLYEKDGKFDNPTKFNLAPIEYPIVADAIYSPSNLNNNKNNRSDIFDCYIGDFKHATEKTFKYTLILYQSTKIVHTFYLNNNSKPYNKRVNLPLRQGWSSGTHKTMSGLQEYSINYIDLNNLVRFTIILRCIPKLKLEKWFLVLYDVEGCPIFTHYLHEEVIDQIIDVPMRMGILDFQDLSLIDRKIKKIIKGTYEFEENFNTYCDYKYL